MPRFLSVAQHDTTTTRPIHGILMGTARKRLVITALPGIRPDGTLPDGLDAQTEQAFDNLAFLVQVAGLKREDVAAVCAYVASAGAKAMIHRVAATKLGGFRAATAVRQVVSLSQGGSLIELDAEVVNEE